MRQKRRGSSCGVRYQAGYHCEKLGCRPLGTWGDHADHLSRIPCEGRGSWEFVRQSRPALAGGCFGTCASWRVRPPCVPG